MNLSTTYKVQQILYNAQQEIAQLTGSEQLQIAVYEGVLPERTPTRMLYIVAKALDMRFVDYRMKTRKPQYVDMRRIGAMCLKRLFPFVTVKQIGHMMQLDHSTIVDARGSGEQWLATGNVEFNEKFDKAIKAAELWMHENE